MLVLKNASGCNVFRNFALTSTFDVIAYNFVEKSKGDDDSHVFLFPLINFFGKGVVYFSFLYSIVFF